MGCDTGSHKLSAYQLNSSVCLVVQPVGTQESAMVICMTLPLHDHRPSPQIYRLAALRASLNVLCCPVGRCARSAWPSLGGADKGESTLLNTPASRSC